MFFFSLFFGTFVSRDDLIVIYYTVHTTLINQYGQTSCSRPISRLYNVGDKDSSAMGSGRLGGV